MREPRTTQQKLLRLTSRVQMTIVIKCMLKPCDAYEELARLEDRLVKWGLKLKKHKEFFIRLACLASLAAQQAHKEANSYLRPQKGCIKDLQSYSSWQGWKDRVKDNIASVN